MFRCKECGQEFDTQPQYCNCGNNEFEDINNIDEHQEPKVFIQKPREIIKETYSSTVIKENFSTFSILFFVLCLFFSVFIILYPIKSNEQIINQEEQETNISNKIPTINKIWDASPIKIQEAPKVEEIKKEDDKQEFQEIKQPKSQQPQLSQIIKQTSIQKNSVQKPAITTFQPQQPNQTVSKVQTQPKQETKVIKKAVNKDELIRYKASLRNKIASRINFAGIIGDGTCVITFSVSTSGELQKHKFKKQSENFSLNDAVYNAIMQTQFYNPPPEGYDGEVMQFVVKIYNGNYEVSLY